MSRVGVRFFSACSKETFIQRLSDKNVARLHPRLSAIKPSMSVLIPLIDVDGCSRILLTQRSSLLRSHRGEICFPGGKADDDETPEQTALRETEEEIGIRADDIEIWGCLRSVYRPSSRKPSAVMPIVGKVNDSAILQQLSVSQHEVQRVFSISVDELYQSVGYTQFRLPTLKYKIPNFDVKNLQIHFGPPLVRPRTRIWGITAVMLHQTLECLSMEYHPSIESTMY